MVISPVSLHLALALLQQGAGGRTRQQLASLLQLEAATECEVRLATRRLLDTYRQHGKSGYIRSHREHEQVRSLHAHHE